MLPGSDADLLLVRPLGGADDEVTGICRSLEPPHIDRVAYDRADGALAAHRRVRTAGGQRGISQRIEPHLPPDVLGVYVLLPVVE